MSRKSAYKQVLSIGTAVVLGFALFTGSLDGAPRLLSPQSDEQAAALAEKQNESPSRTDDARVLAILRVRGARCSRFEPGNQVCLVVGAAGAFVLLFGQSCCLLITLRRKQSGRPVQ